MFPAHLGERGSDGGYLRRNEVARDVVAINVPPHVDQLVACPVGNAWRFPLRYGSECKFIEPKDLPMYMNREARIA